MRETKVNKNMKDRLFRLIFNEKKDLLELYNAVAGRDYSDPEALVITTLENAVYMGMKNDLSFLISGILNLYEHQGSFNPNMPIRGFHYFSDVYREYVDANNMNVYGSRVLMLPTPQYVVFYNGTREEPDRIELRLSDSFLNREPGVKPCLECKATMLNINYDHNQELMEKCKRLKDYWVFIYRVRQNQKNGMVLSGAVEEAVKSCIQEEILSDVLSKNRAEVLNLMLYEYDEQKQRQLDRRDAIAEGEISAIISMIRKKLAKGRTSSTIAEELELEEGYVEMILKLLEGAPRMTDLEIANQLLLEKPGGKL